MYVADVAELAALDVVADDGFDPDGYGVEGAVRALRHVNERQAG
ncbi:hypothetical protein ABZ436_29300 [Micromonospora matsumotoense]